MNRETRLHKLERKAQPAATADYVAILSADDFEAYQAGDLEPPLNARVILPEKRALPQP